MRKEIGFTLVEVMLVIAIIGILAMVAVPSINSFMDSRKVVSAAEDIYGQIGSARAEAIARSQNVSIRITDGASGAWTVGISTNGACDPAITDPANSDACVLDINGAKVLRRIAGADHAGVKIQAGAVLGDTDTITFDPVRGTLTAVANTTITVTSDKSGNELKIMVSPIGRARICRDNATGKRGYSAC